MVLAVSKTALEKKKTAWEEKKKNNSSDDPYAEAKKSCAAAGGTWNSQTNSCDMPTKTPTVSPEEQAQRTSEGNAYIRQREKLAAQQGISSKAAALQLVPTEEAKAKGEELLKQERINQEEAQKLKEATLLPAEQTQENIVLSETDQNIVNKLTSGTKLTNAEIEYAKNSATIKSYLDKRFQGQVESDEMGKVVTTLGVGASAAVLGGVAIAALGGLPTIVSGVAGGTSNIASNLLKVAAPIVGVTGIASLINSNLGNLETAITNQRETMTLVTSQVTSGAISPEEGILLLDELKDSIDEAYSSIQTAGIISTSYRLGGKDVEIKTRLDKAYSQYNLERQKIINFVSGGSMVQNG